MALALQRPRTVEQAAGFEPSPDGAAVLQQVDRFAHRSIDPVARRPERPMRADQMAQLLEEARALGVLTEGPEEGLGVWDDVAGVPLSTDVLRRLARSNAGFALAVHRSALGQWIARRLGVSMAGRGVAAVQGRFGLGRVSLARQLAGVELDDDDRATLADCYGAHAERIVTVADAFAWVVAPVSSSDGRQLAWAAWPRDWLSVRTLAHVHGFDELTTVEFRRSDEHPIAPAGPSHDDETHAGALCLEALGLVSIALGAAERGHAMSRAYAATRRQGGHLIQHHPAVQLLLASSRGALTTVSALVDAVARGPIGRAALGAILAARAEAHPLLCRASNDDLQVFGGSGYMRDTGLEKIVRDQNHLRVIGGSPPELALFVAEWERCRG